MNVKGNKYKTALIYFNKSNEWQKGLTHSLKDEAFNECKDIRIYDIDIKNQINKDYSVFPNKDTVNLFMKTIEVSMDRCYTEIYSHIAPTFFKLAKEDRLKRQLSFMNNINLSREDASRREYLCGKIDRFFINFLLKDIDRPISEHSFLKEINTI